MRGSDNQDPPFSLQRAWPQGTMPSRDNPLGPGTEEVWRQTYSPGEPQGIQMRSYGRPRLLGEGRGLRKSRVLCLDSCTRGLHPCTLLCVHMRIQTAHEGSVQAREPQLGSGCWPQWCWEAALVGIQPACSFLPVRQSQGPAGTCPHCSISRLPGDCGGSAGLKLRTSW